MITNAFQEILTLSYLDCASAFRRDQGLQLLWHSRKSYGNFSNAIECITVNHRRT